MRKTTGLWMTAVAVAAASAVGLTACGQPSAANFPDSIVVQNAEREVITVQSKEEVRVVPDMAELVFAVTSQAENAKDCQEANNRDLTAVIDFLKENGVAETSLQTSNYGLNPTYDWNSGQTITGYEMRTALTVSDIPMAQTGTILSAAVEHGINNIEKVSYLSSQYDASYQDALKKAVESARVKAQAIAEASGRTLGDVSHVEEYSANTQARYTAQMSAGAAMTEEKYDMTVEPGQISVEALISVDFMIN